MRYLMIYEEESVLGATNELDLILSRGEGSFDTDFNDEAIVNELKGKKICQKHLDELSRRWDNPMYNHFYRKHGTNEKVCSFPKELGPQHPQTRPKLTKLRKLIITKEEARAILKQTKVLLHISLRKL
jgi:hypothetical protein